MAPIDRLIESCRTSPKRIGVFGDAMIDVWVHGQSAPSQDGCLKFIRAGDDTMTPGGAANAYEQLEHWNQNTSLFSFRCSPISPPFIPIKRRYVTTENKIVFRDDSECLNYGLTRDHLDVHRSHMIQALFQFHPDAVLICDYDKGLVTQPAVKEIADYCRDRKIPCVADAKQPAAFFQGTILKVNEAYAKANRTSKFYGNVVVTRGSRPPRISDWSTGDGLLPYCAENPVQCMNHVGAGDCFGAHLVLCLAHGLTLAEACQIAHSAGRVYVQHPHNRAPHPHEIAEDLATLAGSMS